MSSNDNSPVPAPPSPIQRRASFAPGQKLSEMFGRTPTSASNNAGFTNSIAAAAGAQANHPRRVSISTLGLSGSPTQTSPFGNNSRARKESMSSSEDSSAIDDTDMTTPASAGPSSFTRRLSFGARAMRDVRGGGAGPGGIFNGEGFNWSDQMRHRAERSTSMSATSPTAASAGFGNPFSRTPPNKASSVAAEPQPPKEMPKASKAPDHFQERILKGDFYMD